MHIFGKFPVTADISWFRVKLELNPGCSSPLTGQPRWEIGKEVLIAAGETIPLFNRFDTVRNIEP